MGYLRGMHASRGKAAYFAFYAANAALLPVLTLYYESLGITGARLGLLASLWPAGGLVGASLWGAVADSTGRHRSVLSLAIVAAIAGGQLFLLGESFPALVAIVAFFAISVAPVGPMLDNAVLEDLGSRSERFGRVRLWGAIGWGVSAPVVGRLTDLTGLRIVFPVYGALMLVLLAASYLLPVSHGRIGANVVRGFRTIAGSPRWRTFLLSVLVTGTGSAFVHHYLYLYLSSIGGSGTLRGVALAVATASELVVFGLADRLLRRVRAQLLILVAMGLVGVRLVLFGVITSPVVALIPQFMHGVTFSLFLVAGVAIARELAPPGMGATAQALFTGTSMGAGGIAGALLGGLLYRSMSVASVFLVAGVAEILLAAGFLVAHLRRRDAGREGAARGA